MPSLSKAEEAVTTVTLQLLHPALFYQYIRDNQLHLSHVVEWTKNNSSCKMRNEKHLPSATKSIQYINYQAVKTLQIPLQMVANTGLSATLCLR